MTREVLSLLTRESQGRWVYKMVGEVGREGQFQLPHRTQVQLSIQDHNIMSRTSSSHFLPRFTPSDDFVEGKNPGRVAAGLKASIHNPNVSDEAKQSATERLHDMGADVDDAPAVQHVGEPHYASTS